MKFLKIPLIVQLSEKVLNYGSVKFPDTGPCSTQKNCWCEKSGSETKIFEKNPSKKITPRVCTIKFYGSVIILIVIKLGACGDCQVVSNLDL